MADDNDHVSIAPTVLEVLEQFVAAMRADDKIDGNAINRLEKLLLQGPVPKPDDIFAAVFEPLKDDDL